MFITKALKLMMSVRKVNRDLSKTEKVAQGFRGQLPLLITIVPVVARIFMMLRAKPPKLPPVYRRDEVVGRTRRAVGAPVTAHPESGYRSSIAA